MKTAIIGIGGVGGYYGGKLALRYSASDEHDVFFVARGDHLERIRHNGLKLITPEETLTVLPSLATDDPRELGSLDLVVLCVKGYALDTASRSIADNLHVDSIVIPLLNGVDNAERLTALLPRGIILNGCVYISSHIVGPGVIEQVGGSGKLLFGPEDRPSAPFSNIESILKNAGINAVLSDTIAVDVWSKYLFVGPLGSITSMTGKSLGEIMENDRYRTMLEKMMREVETIAQAKDIPLPDTIVQQSLDITANFPYETKTSLQLDFEKGRQTEIETFTGYVVMTGRVLGIETPLHNEVYSALQQKIKTG